MIYKIVEADHHTITMWDEVSYDKELQKPHTLTVYLGAPHPFRKEQKVEMTVRLVEDAPLTEEDLELADD